MSQLLRLCGEVHDSDSSAHSCHCVVSLFHMKRLTFHSGNRFIVILTFFSLLAILGFGGFQATDEHASSGHTDPVTPVLLALTAILAGAKLGGELFERIKQPAVLGELIVGVLLGNLVLLNPSWDFFGPLRADNITEQWAVVVDSFARIGVILLLFEVGLESSVPEMRKGGISSFMVGLVGVIAPFFLGYFASSVFIMKVPRKNVAMTPTR